MGIFSKKTVKNHSVSLINHQFIDDKETLKHASNNLFDVGKNVSSYTLLPDFDHCFFIEERADRETAIELTNEKLVYRLNSLHAFGKALEQVDIQVSNVNSATDKYLIKLLNGLLDSRANFKKGVISICATVKNFDTKTQTATIGVIFSGGKESLKNCLNYILF